MFDTAVSHAMLRDVATGVRGESLRLYAPDDALLFSSLDARRPGYPRAIDLAREAGYEPVTRLAGGHAAVFLRESVAFAWASADPTAHLHIQPRFERLTGWIVDALQRLGLDARVGEVPGEYCPGEYSVNIGGKVKVMGVGQRVIRGGAHVGGVLTVGQTAPLREILIPVYEALELEFRPETAGGVADYDAGLTPNRVISALIEAVEATGFTCESATFDEGLESAAEALVPLHGARPVRNPGAALRAASGGKAILNPGAEPDS
ncbi:MAG: lipoate--protein ligase [Deltaproteobacteria bacterium]|nr:lipoate--protein ligase [Deltaproteobacteria bacterium]